MSQDYNKDIRPFKRPRRASQMERDLDVARKSQNPAPLVSTISDWKHMDIKAENYQVLESEDVEAAATVNLPSTSSLCDIFLNFVPPAFLMRIWWEEEPEKWTYKAGGHSNKINRGSLSFPLL
jgi:hypothetical protein